MITHHGRESNERGGCRAGDGAKSLGDVETEQGETAGVNQV